MTAHSADTLEWRGNHLEHVAIAFLVLAWTFIVLRIWTRTYIIASFGWDDIAMISSGLVFTGFCGCVLYIEANGGGTHVQDVWQLNKLIKWTIASEIAYLITVLLLKISLAIFFVRIVVKAWQRRLIYSTICIAAVSSISSVFYCLFRCGPDIGNYILRQFANQCAPRALDRFFAYQHASITFLTDCVFAVLPIAILWNSNMKRTAKLSVGFILSLAALGCVCSAIRFPYVDGLTQVDDFFWNATMASIWSIIEPGAGIMAGCLATLRPLFREAISKVQSIHSASAPYSQNSSFQSSKITGKSARMKDAPDRMRFEDAESFDIVLGLHRLDRNTSVDVDTTLRRERTGINNDVESMSRKV